MPDDRPNSITRIQELNDAFRRSFFGGVVVITSGFESLPSDRRCLILGRLRVFDRRHKRHISVVVINLPEAADIAILDKAEIVLAVRVVVLIELPPILLSRRASSP
jgi:hypothetical protein